MTATGGPCAAKAPAPDGLSALYPALGHEFDNAQLLADALTHVSLRASGEASPYQRLEFLGDRVLGVVVADMLYHRFPDEAEGALAKRHAALVRREALADVAALIDLGAHIRVAGPDANQDLLANPGVLADCCEAVIGALYLDGGLDAAGVFVSRYWEPLLEADPAPPRDPKTALQEWAQARGRPLPEYLEIERSGPTTRRPSWSRSGSRAARPARRRSVQARGHPHRCRAHARPGRAGARQAGRQRRRRGGRPRRMSDGAGATRCGFVALIGAPNAGKSTLINRLVGAKVSIVTPKVQTTRTQVRGVATLGDTQIVFIDTPGIFAPRRRLDRAMVAAAWTGAQDADVVALLVDCRRITDEDLAIVDRLVAADRSAILVLNKIDLVKPQDLLARAAALNARGRFDATFMISAETGDGVADLAAHLAARMPEGPWHYPEDQLSDLSERLMAAEITREKLFLRLRQELPYALTVETDGWQEFDDGSVRIDQTIYVTRPGHKGIVLGKRGAEIQAVRLAAQAEIARELERKVHLFLFVKVRERWLDDPERFAAWGLDYNA
ncbi:MAG: GTPase Era [Alphaproteobacteria bacterium]